MSRRCPIVFIPEDEQHASLMRGYFIGGRGFDYRGVAATKFWTHKRGNYVKARDWFCEEIKLQAAGRRKFGVILLIDEDGVGLSARQKYVADKLAAEGLPSLDPANGRLLVIPMRNVETWMAWAFRWLGTPSAPAGVIPIDETADYKIDPKYRGETKAPAFSVGKLMAEFDPTSPPSSMPGAMKNVLEPLSDFSAWAKLP